MMNNILNEDYEYIPSVKLSSQEKQLINDIINYNEDGTYNIFSLFPEQIIFKEDDNIKWCQNDYEVITQNKKEYYKFKDDDKLYLFNKMSYITTKKQLFLYFNKLLNLSPFGDKVQGGRLINCLDDDIINYLNDKFFNNINKCKYYDCLRWFIYLFIYWFQSFLKGNALYLNKINYKLFRKWILKNVKKYKPVELVKNILYEFNEINYITCQFYEEIKIFLNFIIPCLIHGHY